MKRNSTFGSYYIFHVILHIQSVEKMFVFKYSHIICNNFYLFKTEVNINLMFLELLDKMSQQTRKQWQRLLSFHDKTYLFKVNINITLLLLFTGFETIKIAGHFFFFYEKYAVDSVLRDMFYLFKQSFYCRSCL